MPSHTRAELTGLPRQRAYIKSLGGTAADMGLVVATTFVESMRDVGYRHTGTALDELLDNAIQAGATKIAVIFGFDGGGKKPSRVAVVDNGHGMDPEMIRAAVTWGGTDRHDDRAGFGRFGFGLPSACVSQGRRFCVYSQPEDGNLHRVVVDLDEIAGGKWSRGHVIRVPLAEEAGLPRWLADQLDQHVGDFVQGTAVVIEQLDRLSWMSRSGLQRNLLEHFGLTYRNYLGSTRISVDGKYVEPTDPLFTTPGMRFHDLTPVKAESLEPMEFQMASRKSEEQGVVRVRFSFMPPDFTRGPGGGEAENARFKIMKEHRGLIFCRAGRQIDVLDARCPWRTFANYDRYWGVEIDFSPVLDEEFSITSHKQQVVLTERAWQVLESAGVERAVASLAARVRKAFAEARAQRDERAEGKRPSEEVMEEVQRFKTRRPTPSPELSERAERNLSEEIRRRAAAAGVTEDIVRPEVAREFAEHPFRVKVESGPGGPFFRVDQVGGSRILFLNSDHRFFQDVYSGPSADARLRFQLEALLFVLGDSELDARGDRHTFYQTERAAVWSPLLQVALERLSDKDSVEDELESLDDDQGGKE